MRIGIADGSYSSGAQTVSLALNRTVTLVDTTNGVRYKLRLAGLVSAAGLDRPPRQRVEQARRDTARGDGLGLIELLISLLVLNLGIFATLGAFTSGAVAIRNASRVSTASALADKKIEAFRDMAYSNASFAVGDDHGQSDRRRRPDATAHHGHHQRQPADHRDVPGEHGRQGRDVHHHETPPRQGFYGPASTTFSQCAQDLTTTACGGS